MKISSIICTADILQTLSKITDSNLLQRALHLPLFALITIRRLEARLHQRTKSVECVNFMSQTS